MSSKKKSKPPLLCTEHYGAPFVKKLFSMNLQQPARINSKFPSLLPFGMSDSGERILYVLCSNLALVVSELSVSVMRRHSLLDVACMTGAL